MTTLTIDDMAKTTLVKKSHWRQLENRVNYKNLQFESDVYVVAWFVVGTSTAPAAYASGFCEMENKTVRCNVHQTYLFYFSTAQRRWQIKKDKFF